MKNTNASHTKGPWQTEHSKDSTGAFVLRVQAEKKTVCEVWSLDNANAQLIAAAPELLEALELLISELENGHDGETASIDFAKEAIAKAEGK